MRSGPHLPQTAALIVVAVMTVATPAQQDAPERFEEARGRIELFEGEDRVELRGIQGEIYVRTGTPGELTFISLGEADQDLPLTVETNRTTVELSPTESTVGARRRVWLDVPEDMRVALHVADSEVRVSKLQSGLIVEGERLDVVAGYISGPCDLEVTDGSVRVQHVQDATLTLTRVEGRINDVAGSLDLTAEGSTLEIRDVAGPFSAYLDGSDVIAAQVDAAVELDATGGAVELEGLWQGADLRLKEASLVVKEVQGGLSIDSDADVTVTEVDGRVRIAGLGGKVLGNRLRGAVEILRQQSDVRLQSLSQSLTVEGSGLTLIAESVAGDVMLQLSDSNVVLDDLGAGVDVTNEYGNTSIKKTGNLGVKIRGSEGTISVQLATGPVDIVSDGGRVEVAWSSLVGTSQSTISNENGDVWVRLPKSGGCRIQARSDRGVIETDHKDILVSPDGESASGTVNRRRTPTVTVAAGRDIYLLAHDSELQPE